MFKGTRGLLAAFISHLTWNFADEVKIRWEKQFNHLIHRESCCNHTGHRLRSSQVGEGEEWSCPLSRRVRARCLRLLSARESNRVPCSSQPCLKMMEADRSGINLKVSALWALSGNSPGNHSTGAQHDESTNWKRGGRGKCGSDSSPHLIMHKAKALVSCSLCYVSG